MLLESKMDDPAGSTEFGEENAVNGAVIPPDCPAYNFGTTILLAEDDDAVRNFVSSLLQQAGYQVLVADNGRRSLELCRNHPSAIHALITDVVMPEMNGRELAESAKQIRPGLKIIFVSGYVDRSLKEDDSHNPSYAFLQKPFTAEDLLSTLSTLCSLSN